MADNFASCLWVWLAYGNIEDPLNTGDKTLDLETRWDVFEDFRCIERSLQSYENQKFESKLVQLKNWSIIFGLG